MEWNGMGGCDCEVVMEDAASLGVRGFGRRGEVCEYLLSFGGGETRSGSGARVG